MSHEMTRRLVQPQRKSPRSDREFFVFPPDTERGSMWRTLFSISLLALVLCGVQSSSAQDSGGSATSSSFRSAAVPSNLLRQIGERQKAEQLLQRARAAMTDGNYELSGLVRQRGRPFGGELRFGAASICRHAGQVTIRHTASACGVRTTDSYRAAISPGAAARRNAATIRGQGIGCQPSGGGQRGRAASGDRGPRGPASDGRLPGGVRSRPDRSAIVGRIVHRGPGRSDAAGDPRIGTWVTDQSTSVWT